MNYVSIRLLLSSIRVAKVVQLFGETQNNNFCYFIVMRFLLPCSLDKYATFDITCIKWRHDNFLIRWISNELLFMTFFKWITSELLFTCTCYCIIQVWLSNVFRDQLDYLIFLYRLIDWLIVYWFTSCLRRFHSNRDVTDVNTGLQSVCLFARRWRSLNREGSLSCHTQCDTRPRFTSSRPKDIFSLYLTSR